MLRIIGSLFQSLDGVIQAPGGPEEDPAGFAHGGWVFPYFDDALAEPMGRLMGGSYELLLGRRTYEIFAAYWPHNGDQPTGETFYAFRKARRDLCLRSPLASGPDAQSVCSRATRQVGR